MKMIKHVYSHTSYLPCTDLFRFGMKGAFQRRNVSSFIPFIPIYLVGSYNLYISLICLLFKHIYMPITYCMKVGMKGLNAPALLVISTTEKTA